jgi:hypothetical protein
MMRMMISLFVIGVTLQFYAQEPKVERLDEITIVAKNYKYLDKAGAEDVAIPIQQLQRKVATYNIKELDIYEDEYDYYDVSFIIPEGKILASYDKDGNILRTAEKFKDINLPATIVNSIVSRFPSWSISKNVYLVYYHDRDGIKKTYKIILENGDKRIKIKMDDLGNYL